MEDLDYVTFILIREYEKKLKLNGVENDIAFERCKRVAEEFLQSGYNEANKSLYECLQKYMKNYHIMIGYELVTISTEDFRHEDLINMLSKFNLLYKKIENWGKKKLAYNMDRKEKTYSEGYFSLVEFEVGIEEKEKIDNIQKVIREKEDEDLILKHIMLKI